MTQSRKMMMIHHQTKIQNKIMMKQVINKPRKKKKTNTTTKTIPVVPTITTTTSPLTTIPIPIPIPCLPDEIIFFHILPKLPVRSLLRFNCVSKLWYETTNKKDLNFVALHFNHSKSKPSLFALFQDRLKLRFLHLEGGEGGYPASNVDDDKPYYSSVDIVDDPSKVIIGSCNGLTCTKATDHIGIINPSTRELLAIPHPDVFQVSSVTFFVFYGFGFDPYMNEYKLIHIRLYVSKQVECVIYTLGTHSWRNITATSNCQQSYIPFDVAPICSSGSLFWMTAKYNILSFDVHHEIFQVIPCPNVPKYLIRHSLFELRGSPCLVYRYDKLVDGLEFRLYSLTGYHLHMHTTQQQSRNWIREKGTVSLPFKPDTSFIRVVTFSEHTFLQWINNDGQFILYNASKGRTQTKSSGLMCESYNGPHHVLLVNHVENLISLKTLLPPGATKVKYVSSRESTHESPTTPCSERQREKREKERLKILRSKGFLSTSCWFSII